MKILYLECSMGAAGDMLMAALSDLLPEKEEFIREMNSLGIPGVEISSEPAVKCGITGNHITVKIHGEEEDHGGHHHHHDHEHTGEEHHHHHGHEHTGEEHHHHHGHEHTGEEHHHHDHEQMGEGHHHHHDHGHHSHTGMEQIRHWISHLPVSGQVKKDIAAVYGLIAEAESHAHGRPVDQIHFHEVGSLDALADVTGVCLLMEKLSPDQVIVSPIHVGSGHVHCAHGILPVPAPATAHILRDVPVYGGQVQGELCTPTGAALLKYFADRFGAMPVMTADRIGYGMGNREFETANCIRAFLGESGLKNQEEITELTCNIDDMTGEELGALYEILSEAGALDVSLLPAVMKKNRPGHLLLCVTAPEKADQVAEAILRHTSTLGVRRNQCSRYVLEREMETRRTKYGEIRCKHSYGYGADKRKPEWEDVLALSRKAGVAAAEVEKEFYRCEDRTAE